MSSCSTPLLYPHETQVRRCSVSHSTSSWNSGSEFLLYIVSTYLWGVGEFMLQTTFFILMKLRWAHAVLYLRHPQKLRWIQARRLIQILHPHEAQVSSCSKPPSAFSRSSGELMLYIFFFFMKLTYLNLVQLRQSHETCWAHALTPQWNLQHLKIKRLCIIWWALFWYNILTPQESEELYSTSL